MSSMARVKFIKTRVIFRYHTKGVSDQVSSNSDHEIKSYSRSNSITKMVKNEKGQKKSGLQNRAIRRLQIETGFRITNRAKRDYKQEQLQGFQVWPKRLQIGAEITIEARRITNRGRDYKSVQNTNTNYFRLLFSRKYFIKVLHMREWF